MATTLESMKAAAAEALKKNSKQALTERLDAQEARDKTTQIVTTYPTHVYRSTIPSMTVYDRRGLPRIFTPVSEGSRIIGEYKTKDPMLALELDKIVVKQSAILSKHGVVKATVAEAPNVAK